jgi:hypothetical protein
MKKIAFHAGYPLKGFTKDNFINFHRKIGFNSGNILFKVGSVVTTCQDIHAFDYIDITKSDINFINETYDYVLYSGANLINPKLKHVDYHKLSSAIKRLKIPYITLSIGAQADSYRCNLATKLPKKQIEYIKVISDACNTIGVRGNYTAEVLNLLGIKNVAIIGCPSIYSKGLDVLNNSFNPTLEEVSCNFTPIKAHKYFNLRLLEEAHLKSYTVIKQSNALAQKLLFFPDEIELKDFGILYKNIIDLYLQNKLRFFGSYKAWVKYFEHQTFCFGTRIHGNIAAVLGGTACNVIIHDSRTYELCEYLNLPYTKLSDISKHKGMIANYLVDTTNMDSFITSFKDKLTDYIMFLETNSIAHNFDENLHLKNNFLESIPVNMYELSPTSQDTAKAQTLESLLNVLLHSKNIQFSIYMDTVLTTLAQYCRYLKN